ncbi:MAG TPA: amidohydrolase family protein, partial [Rubricoccaceae bacterium]|nr:amidohydrolase family protein [Rubricoccaceae bacterium]
MLRLFPLALLIAPMAAAQPRAYVLHHARIYTVNPAQPTATAMAVEDGRIASIGTEAEVLAVYPDWPRVDAGGHTVIPGLIDAHAHLMGLGQFLTQVDLVGTASKAEVIERARAFAETLPEGAWLMGRGWDQNAWPAAPDGTHPFPTRADLDAVFPDRPVYLRRVDGHAGWVNTAALRALGIAPETRAPEAPPGGAIEVDAAGRPTGIFLDAAEEQLIENVVPPPSRAELEERLRRALAMTARYGLTGVHEAGVRPDTLAVYQAALEAGTFSIRNYAMIEGPGALLDSICTGGPILGASGRLWMRALKLYMDGALGSRGAALLADYADDPGNRGLLRYTPEAYR